MGRYQLNDVLLILRDLLGAKLSLWNTARCAGTYEALLQSSLRAIEGLPHILTTPKSVDTRATDLLHDRRGRAISCLLDAYAEHDQTPEALREALEACRQAFIPSRSELSAAYADEAARAIQRQPLLKTHEAVLRGIPLAGGVTLYDWVLGFLEQGMLLDRKIREQAEAQIPEGTRAEAGRLFNEAVGRIARFRAALADEVESNPLLARNLEAQVFAYADELKERRGNKKPKREQAEEESPLPNSEA